MTFCTACGTGLGDAVRFCSSCGNPVRVDGTGSSKAGPPLLADDRSSARRSGWVALALTVTAGIACLAVVLVATVDEEPPDEVLVGDEGRAPADDESLADDSSSPEPPGDVFHAEGFGSIEIGMTEAEVRAVTPGIRWEVAIPGGTCSSVEFAAYPEIYGLSGDGVHLSYIDVYDYEHDGVVAETAEGVALGDAEARVSEVYGDVDVSTRPYAVEPDHWLIVDLPANNAYIFGTTNGTIDQIRVGRQPEVGAIEGCA